MNIQNYISLALKGAAMGVAEVIPGVSGGTIAFITGIYEQLIESIRSFDLHLLGLITKGQFKASWDYINGPFLLGLILGMLGGVIIGVFVISHLLETHPALLWSFFFGLILASVYVIFKMLQKPSSSLMIPFILGVIVSYLIVSFNPHSGSENFLYLFVCGAIAISALILPGISGSFLLLLLGMYTLVMPTLKEFIKSPEWSEFKILAVFGAGCVLGLAVFSRFLSWTFRSYHDITLAILCGFMIGSLPKIWPWRNPVQLINKDSSEIITLNESNQNLLELEHFKVVKEIAVLPSDYLYANDSSVFLVVLTGIVGFTLVFLLAKFYPAKS